MGLQPKSVNRRLVLCRDCKWCENPRVPHSFCLHDSAVLTNVELSIVTGRPKNRDKKKYCTVHRGSYWGEDTCGPNAKYFEPRSGNVSAGVGKNPLWKRVLDSIKW